MSSFGLLWMCQYGNNQGGAKAVVRGKHAHTSLKCPQWQSTAKLTQFSHVHLHLVMLFLPWCLSAEESSTLKKGTAPTTLLRCSEREWICSCSNQRFEACHKYIISHPGRVITSDVIAALVEEAWPMSLTPVSIMSGFKECGIYPINPGEVSNRQLDPSKAWNQALTNLLLEINSSHQKKRCCANIDTMKAMTWLTMVTWLCRG